MKMNPVGRTALAVTELSFGGASLEYRSHPEAEGDALAEAVLQAAWDAGLRHFDTAPHYGLGTSERRLGRFLSARPRQDFTISTKVGRLIVPDGAGGLTRLHDYSHDGILRSVEESLARSGLDRFDILFVHDIGTMVHGEAGNARHLADLCGSGLRALDRLRSDGTISAWGLGVNEVAICQTMLDRAQMDMILLAGRYTLLDGEAGTDLFGRCIAEGVSILLGGVFNSGILASGAVPGARYQYRPASEEILEKTRQIEAVCAAHGVPLSAAALQFGRGHAAVASILIGTSSPASLHRNLDDLARPIPAALWRDLAAAGLARHHELVSA